MKAKLRLMRAEDATALHVIDETARVCGWTEDAYVRESENPMAVYYVLERDGQPFAYAGMWCIAGEGELMNIGVLPDLQGRGYGTILLKALIVHGRRQGCRTISLEVKEQNEKAIAFYRNMGFEPVGFRKNYYKDGSNALLMQRKEQAKEQT